MCRLLDLYAPKLSIVFCNTKSRWMSWCRRFRAEVISRRTSRDLKQMQRVARRTARNGRTDILVATDVAARGIDVGDVRRCSTMTSPDDEYCAPHRPYGPGRTEGKAFSLVVGREVYKLRDIQRYCKTRIIPQAIPSLNDITEIRRRSWISRGR